MDEVVRPGARSGDRAPSASLPRPRAADEPPAGLVRRRLVEALEPTSRARITVLLGPQGAGRTTALAHWAHLTRNRVEVLDGPRDAPSVARAVAGALDRGVVVLALDDADQRPETVHVLRVALREHPGLRLVLTGRRVPDVDLARGDLTVRVLPADTLRFREHEVSTLYREHHDAPLAQADVARLVRHTAGWAAGLQLFSLVVAGSTPDERSRAVATLSRRVDYARHHLRHRVLDALSPEAVALMRATSPLEVLTPASCRALLGVEVRGLSRLDACPLVGSPDAGHTRVLHPVLRTHLLTELRDELGDAEVDDLLRRSASVQATAGEPAAAARALVRAGGWAGLDDLLAGHGTALWESRDVAWVGDVPDPVVDGSPLLRTARAVDRLHDGRLVPALQDAARVLGSATAPEHARRAAAGVAATAAGWIEGTPLEDACREDLLACRALGGTPSPVRVALERPATVAGQRLLRAPADAERVLAGVIAHLLRGDADGARSAAGAGSTDAGLLDLATRLVVAAPLGPGPDQTERLARQARTEHRPWLARTVDLLDEVREYAEGRPGPDPLLRRTHESDEAGDLWGAALACTARAAALLRTGRPDVPALEDLCDRWRELGAPALEAWARSALALAAVVAEVPDADRDAQVAISFAMAVQLPAPTALAHLAAAHTTRPPQPDHLALARSEAATVGLSLDAWVRMLRPDSPASVRDAVAPLSVTCFGQFEIAVDGRPPALRQVRPRAREVLRLLAVHGGRAVHREVLLEALWPDLDVRAATHNLHVAVSTLRTCLEPGVPRGASALVVREGEHYQLAHPPGTQCDLTAFDRALATATLHRATGDAVGTRSALERALDLYRGDVLPEDGPAEWVTWVRDDYRLRAGEAAGDLAELHLRASDHHAAVAAARRSIDLSPWRDASWRTLEAACLAAGDRAAAERVRSGYREMLAGLGLPPA